MVVDLLGVVENDCIAPVNTQELLEYITNYMLYKKVGSRLNTLLKIYNDNLCALAFVSYYILSEV